MDLIKIQAAASGRDETVSRQMEVLRDRLGSALRIADELSISPSASTPKQPVNDRYIRQVLQWRRRRDQFFGDHLFADPAWDILLELYAASLAQYRVSVSNLCVGAAVPATTALRWIKQLEDDGLIARTPDPMDGRRHFLMLSNKGLGAMNSYFSNLPGAPLI